MGKQSKLFRRTLITIIIMSMVLTSFTVVFSEADKLIEADTTLNWPQFMGNLELQGISDAKTPRTGEEMELKWKYTESRGEGDWITTPGTPIVVGDYTYCYIYEKLIKFETSTGKVVKTAPAPGDAAFFINLAYGDGKIFAPRHVEAKKGKPGKTYLIAYDADTLEQLFVTDSIADGAQIQAQVFYNDGYVYTGPRCFNGKYVAFKTTDIDLSRSDEVIKPAWTIETDTMLGFGTNAGPAFVNGAIIFADQGKKGREGSKVWSVDAKTGKVIDSMILPNKEVVSSTIVYYRKNNRIYINATDHSKGAVVRSFEMNNDGSFKKGSMKAYISDVKGGGTQASPVIYNDRLYLTGGGRTMGSAEPFHVIDANTMQEIYRIDEIKTKGTPILTTAYATKKSNQEVYIYLVPYAPENAGTDKAMSVMYIVRDSIGQTEPRFEKVSNVGEPQYASQSMAISLDGNMVFYNDARILYCYGNKNDTTIGAQDIINQIERLPDPTGAPYYNSFEIKRIFERYEALSDKEKTKVTNFDKLQKILENVDFDPIEYLIKGIDSLPKFEDITLDNQSEVLSLRVTYDKLSNEDKAKVTNLDKLFKSIEKIEKLEKNVSAKGVTEAIDKIRPVKEITSQDKVSITAARAKYDELNDDSKKLVENISKLEEAEKRLQKILTQIENADNLIKNTLVGIPINIHSKSLINSVDKAIEGLTSADLGTIISYEQYFIPAKIDYINSLISNKLMNGNKKIIINENNVDEIKGIVKEVQACCKSIPKSEKKYIENYEVVTEILKDISCFNIGGRKLLNEIMVKDNNLSTDDNLEFCSNSFNIDNNNPKFNNKKSNVDNNKSKDNNKKSDTDKKSKDDKKKTKNSRVKLRVGAKNSNLYKFNHKKSPKSSSKNYAPISIIALLTGAVLFIYKQKIHIKK